MECRLVNVTNVSFFQNVIVDSFPVLLISTCLKLMELASLLHADNYIIDNIIYSSDYITFNTPIIILCM